MTKFSTLSFFLLSIVACVVFGQGLAKISDEDEIQLRIDAIQQSLRISLDTTEYLIHQPIWLDIFLINPEDEKEEIQAPTLYGDWFKVYVMSESGDTLEDQSPQGMFITTPMASPTPGDTGYIFINLQDSFGQPNKLGVPSLEPGSYEVIAVYPGKMSSNKLSFHVRSPMSKEVDAFEHFVEIAEWRLKDKRASVVAFEAFVDNNPGIPYSPLALELAYQICRYGVEDRGLADQIGMKLMKTYPNSGYAVSRFMNVAHSLSKDSSEALLDELIAKHGTNRLRLAARPILRSDSRNQH